MVGEENRANQSIYVTSRSDNAAATKDQATKNVGIHDQDFEQPVEMVALDSFFPSGTKVQNLKIDVQGFELQVLHMAQREY
jgi:FkbM family methyltransferase